MQRKIALIVHALTVAGAVAGFSFSAAAQTHYRFAHDQQLNSGYSVAYDIFSAKLKQLSGGQMTVDQYPGAQLGQEPQLLQLVKSGDLDFAMPLVGATHEKARVVKDGNVIIGGGVTAGIDLGLGVVAEIAGETMARKIQLGIEYDPAPPFDSGDPDKAPALKAELLSARYDEFRATYRTRIRQAVSF
jgi:Bacterial extracellular solute-binding protein, family 7